MVEENGRKILNAIYAHEFGNLSKCIYLEELQRVFEAVPSGVMLRYEMAGLRLQKGALTPRRGK